MTLDKKLVEEACLEFWNKYHEKIEKTSYILGKQHITYSSGEIAIMAKIIPTYSSKKLKEFKKIIPEIFNYKGKEIPIVFYPPIDPIFNI